MLAAVAAALLAFDEPAATASARTALLRAIELARDPDDVAAVAPSVRRLAGADLTAALRATATRIRKLDVKGAEATRRKNEAARALLVLANAAPP
jgi:predicted MarR family transcription regulator